MAKIPDMNLSPQSTPWGREIQSRLENSQRDVAQLTQSLDNLRKTVNASIVPDVNPATIIIDMSQVPTGNLDGSRISGSVPQANVSGTWSKGVNTTSDIYTSNNLYTLLGRTSTVTSSFVGAWINSDGRVALNSSSVYDKQDFEPYDGKTIAEALYRLGLLRFRRIGGVEELGDDAPYEAGAIAQYMEGTPLKEYVFYDSEGNVQGINWAMMTPAIIAALQNLNQRLLSLENGKLV